VSRYDPTSSQILELEPPIDHHERYRLRRRVRRLTVTLEWLHQYADDRQAEPLVHTKYIRQAIEDFERQIEAMNTRLHELALSRTSVGG
jgi:hypothetical protein